MELPSKQTPSSTSTPLPSPSTNNQRVALCSFHPLQVHVPSSSSPHFLFRYPNSTFSDILTNGIPEQSLIDWCQQFCRKDQTFLDIGAHCGMYSLQLSSSVAQVHAFECQRETFYQLCGGIALNAAWNVYAHYVALGDRSMENVPIYVQSLDGGGTSLFSNSQCTPFETQMVSMKPLDDFSISNICFIKIDAEGAEATILRGARQTLAHSNYPPILFEVNNSQQGAETYQILHAYKYRIVNITGYPHMKLAVVEN